MQVIKAYTLVEILIVIALVGTLALVAVPSYKIYLARAKVMSAYQIMEKVKVQIVEYYQENNVFPPNVMALGYTQSTSPNFSNDLNNGIITGFGIYDYQCQGSGTTLPCFWIYLDKNIFGTAYDPDLVISVRIRSNDRVDYICSTETSGVTMPTTYLPKGCMLCTGVNTGCVTY